jgi:hypothetical protein
VPLIEVVTQVHGWRIGLRKPTLSQLRWPRQRLRLR